MRAYFAQQLSMYQEIQGVILEVEIKRKSKI